MHTVLLQLWCWPAGVRLVFCAACACLPHQASHCTVNLCTRQALCKCGPRMANVLISDRRKDKWCHHIAEDLTGRLCCFGTVARILFSMICVPGSSSPQPCRAAALCLASCRYRCPVPSLQVPQDMHCMRSAIESSGEGHGVAFLPLQAMGCVHQASW